jgi:hypothetical protein
LRALPTTPSTARGPLSSSTLLTLLVSGIGGGEKALVLGEEVEGLGQRVEVWTEEIGRKSCMSKSKQTMARWVWKTSGEERGHDFIADC